MIPKALIKEVETISDEKLKEWRDDAAKNFKQRQDLGLGAGPIPYATLLIYFDGELKKRGK